FDRSLRYATTFYQYDGSDGPPLRGDATLVASWLDQNRDGKVDPGDAWVQSQREYDDRGNQVTATEPVQATVRIEYDAVHRRFPVAETDPVGHVTSTDWDPVCGAPTRRVDPNGAVVVTTYDAMCRPISETGPLPGMFKRFDYGHLTGDPTAQYLATS